MTTDRKITAKIPVIAAAACLAIVLVVAVFTLAGGAGGGVAQPATAPCACPAATPFVPVQPPVQPPVNLPACPAALWQASTSPAVPEVLASADLVLTRPPAADRVPYTARAFPASTTAAIAWWMSPGFMDNTTEFRMYQRSTPEQQAGYPEEHRIFFAFIEAGLDDAEKKSVLNHDIVLFRGIGPGLATTVLDYAIYREPSFASTSYDISLSLDAFSTVSPDGYRNILVLERQAGDHALYINEDEREYLLPRGTSWHIVKAADVENLTVKADFPLHNRNATTAFFDHVRLISVAETTCI